jgi:integrase
MGRYTVHTVNGPKQKTVYGRTRAEAAEKLTKAMADRDCGLIFQAGTVTLGQYMERWLEDSVRDTVRSAHLRAVRAGVPGAHKTRLGQVKLMVLTSAHIRGLIRQKLDAGLSGSSVRQVHVTLNKALKQAVDDCLVPRNVAASVKAPRPRKEEVRPLERDRSVRSSRRPVASGWKPCTRWP